MKTLLFSLLVCSAPVMAQSNTPFEKAMSQNNVAAATQIANSPDFSPNEKSPMGFFPLLFATSQNRPAITKMLLALPATDPNIKSEYGETALDNAIFKPGTALVSALLAHPKINPHLEGGDPAESPAVRAIGQGRNDILKMLLAHPKFDARRKNKWEQNLLFDAIENNNAGAIGLLLATKKLDVNARDNNKTAPIHRAAGSETKTLAAFLKAKNIKINALSDENESPIVIATRLNPGNLTLIKKYPGFKLSPLDKKQIKAIQSAPKGDLG